MAKSLDIIPYMQKRAPLFTETFLIPISLKDSEDAHSITSLANQLVSEFFWKSPLFQQKNYRYLTQKIKILVHLVESITDSGTCKHKTSMVTFLTEFYVLLNRARDLLNYCLESSPLKLLMSTSTTSRYFYDLDREILCILDVITSENMNLNEDDADLLQSMRNQLGREFFCLDPYEESLKSKIFVYYESLEAGEVPDYTNVYKYFVKDLGIRDAKTWRKEIESLQDLILRPEREINIPSSVLSGLAALMNYSRLLISYAQNEFPTEDETWQTLDEIPNEFLCPISHDLMMDPVTLKTGQTFDRTAIQEWFRRGNLICPVTRASVKTMSEPITLIPNIAVKSLISKWCASQGIPYNRPHLLETPEEHRRYIQANSSNKAVSEALKATVKLILDIFSNGMESAQIFALKELRRMTDVDKKTCIEVVNAGSIPFLVHLLKSENLAVQENAVVSILHLSRHTENRISIIRAARSLETLLAVVRSAQTGIIRGHAIGTFHYLSTVPEYTRKIAKVKGLLKTMSAALTGGGSLRYRTCAMVILGNLSTLENRILLIKAGVIKAMVKAMQLRVFRATAINVLAVLVTLSKGAKKIRKEKFLVQKLTRILERGTPIESLAAAKTLLAFYMHGGSVSMQRSLRRPDLRSRVIGLLLSRLPGERIRGAWLIRLYESFSEWL